MKGGSVIGATLDDGTLIERILDYWPKRPVNDGIFETRSVGVKFSAVLEVPLIRPSCWVREAKRLLTKYRPAKAVGLSQIKTVWLQAPATGTAAHLYRA